MPAQRLKVRVDSLRQPVFVSHDRKSAGQTGTMWGMTRKFPRRLLKRIRKATRKIEKYDAKLVRARELPVGPVRSRRVERIYANKRKWQGHKRHWQELRQEKLAAASRASENFRYSEFDCHDGTKVPRASYRALDHLCNTYLEPLRARFGPVTINSGYRPRGYNARIGGASQSLHIYDFQGRRSGAAREGALAVAADVRCRRGTPTQWAAFLEGLNPGGLCAYPNSGFVHVDNRQRLGMVPARDWL